MGINDIFDKSGRINGTLKRMNGKKFICEQCGKETYRPKFRSQQIEETGAKVFCDRECQNEWHNANLVKTNCMTCGAELIRRPSHVKKSSFCSRECTDNYGVQTVKCSWPGCECDITARKIYNKKAGVEVWKTDLVRGGTYVRWPMCEMHKALADQNLPEGHRLVNGNQKWFNDPSTDLGTRGVSAIVTKLMIWAKSDGCCGRCSTPLDLHEKPRKWNIDHDTPVFKGGLTTYWNLNALCHECHRTKSAPERAEASRSKGGRKAGRGLTHPEKDALIVSLRDQVDRLTTENERLKEAIHAPEDFSRRVPFRKEGLRKVGRHADESRQGRLFLER